jgi:alpha/beta superfamily hydrolase
MTKLPLPSPRSPSGLDEKILAYAKQQLPEKKPYRPALWLSGLATASVVAIAVIIAIPEQSRTIVPVVKPARLSAQSEKVEQPPAPRGAAMKESADMEMMVQRSARKQSTPQAAAALYAEQEVAAADTVPILDTITIQQQLQEMSTLVKSGDSKQASLDYRELKKLCPHCDLPDTLKEAIEKYLTGD